MNEVGSPGRGWWVEHAPQLKTTFRILLGLVWLVDGALKFISGYVDIFLSDVESSQANAPGWLSGWYSFWATQASAHATLIVYTVGVLEVLLGAALVLGFLRKIAYSAGVVLSLLIWAVPEGFGGPYTGGSGATDVGTGLIYAIAFLGLIVINATYGTSRWSLDSLIERKFPAWARVAEFGRTGAGPVDPARTTGTSSG